MSSSVFFLLSTVCRAGFVEHLKLEGKQRAVSGGMGALGVTTWAIKPTKVVLVFEWDETKQPLVMGGVINHILPG